MKRPFRWRWQLPALPYDSSRFMPAVGTEITVEPLSAHRERWVWRVDVMFQIFKDQKPHRSLLGWEMGGSRRSPTPDSVGGTARSEGVAWERARAVVADWNDRKAAEELRQSMIRKQGVPQ